MKFTDIVGFGSELCLYMATAGFFISLFGETLSPALYIAAALVCEICLALSGGRKGLMRYFPLIIMIPLFAAAKSVAAAVLPVPIVMLFVMRAREDAWSADYELTGKLFSAGLAVYLFMFASALLLKKYSIMAERSMPYCIIWLALSVLNMRLMRNNDMPELGRRYKALNVALVALIVAGGFFLSSDFCARIFKVILAGLAVFYSNVISPVLYGLAYVVSAVFVGIMWVIRKIFSLFGNNALDEELNEVFLTGGTVEGAEFVQAETPEWLVRLAIALAVGVFLTVMFLMMRKLVASKRKRTEQSSPVVREKLSGPEKKRGRNVFSKSPADVVRRCYCKYLESCSFLGLAVDGTVLSDELSALSGEYTGGDTEKLRRLWLKARFSDETVDDGDAKRAKEAIKQIRADVRKNSKA